jgi:multisubunit Na+/H+ antiporter MnhC subunit
VGRDPGVARLREPEGRIMFQYMMCFLIFTIGIYAVAGKKNLVKSIFGFIFMEYACVTILLLGSRNNMQVQSPVVFASVLLMTGLASTLVLCALVMRIFERYRTVDPNNIRKLRG